MKKMIMFLGMLSLGLAHAQQNDPYEGNVGINTENPEATLTVKSQKGLGPYSRTFELYNAADRKLLLAFDHGKISFNSGNIAEYRFDINSIGEHYNYNSMALRVISNAQLGGAFELFRARGKAIGDNNVEELLAVQKGDVSSAIHTRAYSGNKYIKNAGILTSVTGDVTSNDIPTSMGFYTTNKGNTLNQIMTIHHSENVGIGTEVPENKLHIKADADPLKLEGLQETTATTAKNLVVENGVVKVGSVSTATNEIKRDGAPTCSGAGDAGKINFGEITLNGKKTEAFGFCMKNGSTGNYGWYYIHGAASTTTGSAGAFGNGLQ